MSDERRKPGVTFWSAVALVMVLMYILSVGPVIWLYAHKAIPAWADGPIECFYSPLDWIAHNAPDPIRAPLIWYADQWRSKR